ncbi:MAG: hypothetical protein H6711_25425 [Myxococcales bacterium]|nr:hypothetical protein [Myxococcales bacterium]
MRQRRLPLGARFAGTRRAQPPRRFLLWIAALALLPAEAQAAGGVASETFERVLTGFAIVGAAYLVSHLLFERIARRFAVISGVEYILLGALAGPGFGLISGDVRVALHPFMILGASALGMSAGIELLVRGRALQLRELLAALVIAATTAAVVALPPLVGLLLAGDPALVAAWSLPLIAAVAVALCADATPVRAFAALFGAESDELRRAERIAALGSTAGIITFGAIFCLSDGLGPGISHPPAVILRLAAFQTGAGALLGLVFALFLRQRLSAGRLLTVMFGMVIFAAGLAFHVHVSAIATNFMIGLVVANASAQSGEVQRMLRGIRRPLYIVLFFFAGLDLVQGAPWWGHALALPYVVLRLWGRRLGGALTRRLGGPGASALGDALIAPGGLSVGLCLMALLFFGQGQDPAMRIAVAALIDGVALSELLAYPLTRRWLIDAADVPPERAARRGHFSDEEN